MADAAFVLVGVLVTALPVALRAYRRAPNSFKRWPRVLPGFGVARVVVERMAVVGHLRDTARAGNRADLRCLGSIHGFHGASRSTARSSSAAANRLSTVPMSTGSPSTSCATRSGHGWRPPAPRWEHFSTGWATRIRRRPRSTLTTSQAIRRPTRSIGRSREGRSHHPSASAINGSIQLRYEPMKSRAASRTSVAARWTSPAGVWT